jgi:hypothetical protein
VQLVSTTPFHLLLHADLSHGSLARTPPDRPIGRINSLGLRKRPPVSASDAKAGTPLRVVQSTWTAPLGLGVGRICEKEESGGSAASIGEDEIRGIRDDCEDHIAGMESDGGVRVGGQIVEKHVAGAPVFFQWAWIGCC